MEEIPETIKDLSPVQERKFKISKPLDSLLRSHLESNSYDIDDEIITPPDETDLPKYFYDKDFWKKVAEMEAVKNDCKVEVIKI